MTIDTIAISDIKPYEKNAKSHPKKQVDLLAENIKRFGFTTPCLVDKDNNLIAGHGRLEAVKTLGWTDVPCVRMENLTDDEVKALRLADNKLAEMSEWDMALVTDELKELDDELLDLTGFDKDLIIEPDEKDDVVPEVPVEPQSVLGDLYELGGHRVLCGDSTKIEDVERLMDGKKADMVFTDPPYGISLDTEYNSSAKVKGNSYSKVIGDENDFDPSFLSSVAGTTNQFWWGANYYQEKLPKGGSWVVWDKSNIEQDKAQGSAFEICYSFQKHRNCFYRKLWKGFTAKEKDERRSHPTQKPVEMCLWFIKEWGKQSDIVFDPFLGSGSTLIAAEKTGRICYGMELDPKYIDVIVQRYVDYTGNATIKKNGEEITWSKTPTKTPQG